MIKYKGIIHVFFYLIEINVSFHLIVKHQRPKLCNRRSLIVTALVFIVMMFAYQRTTVIYTDLPTGQFDFEEWIHFYWEYAEQHANDASRFKANFKPNEPLSTEIMDKARDDEITTATTCPMVIRKETEQVHRLPDVIVIGFEKCGTGTVSFLDCHPDVVYRSVILFCASVFCQFCTIITFIITLYWGRTVSV